MAVCLVCGNICMTAPASAGCSGLYAQERRDCEEQEARTEYMKREAELMKKKSEYIEHCQRYPSLCK